MNKDEALTRMAHSIVNGNKEEAVRLAEQAVKTEMDLNEVIDLGYIPGIQKVGDLWKQGEYFLPELITSAECMKAVMNVLQPELKKNQIESKSLGKVIIGTVEGDIHDIGKNLVASMLSANGFEVIDLGADVKSESFVKRSDEENADLLCLSALLTTTMLEQKGVIELLRQRNPSSRIKVLVGGAPVNKKWADEIGADGYAENAMVAVKVAKELL